MADGVVMVLNLDWPKLQIQQLLDRWTPDILVTTTSLQPWVSDAISIPIVSVDLPIFWETVSTDQPDQRYRQRDKNPPFYIGFTSGTTGQPKGVLRRHQSWIQSIAASQVAFDLHEGDRRIVPGALVHSLSLYTAVEALVTGATVYLCAKFSPKLVVRQIQAVKATQLIAVPTLLHAIAKTATQQAIQLPSVRSVISAGAKLSPALRQRLLTIFPNTASLEYYGASELSFVTLASSQDQTPPESVGQAFPGVTLSVRNEDGTCAAIGEVGWIGIQSQMICSGYLDPCVDSGFRIQSGWATVGDRGWLDEQGYLYLVGRERDMLISNGINVYPAEIEAVLLQFPHIDQAVVVGLPDDCRGDRLCAVLQGTRPNLPSRTELITAIAAKVGQAKCPRRFFVVDHLPLTSSSKIIRADLPAKILRGELGHELR